MKTRKVDVTSPGDEVRARHLEWKLKSGDIFSLGLQSTHIHNAPGGELPQATITAETQMFWEVINDSEQYEGLDGVTLIHCHIGRAKLTVTDPDGSFGYDSSEAKQSDDAKALMDAMPAMSGEKLLIRLYADGTRINTEYPFKETRILRASPIVDALESCFPLFPREPVGPNATWRSRNEEYRFKDESSVSNRQAQHIERTRHADEGIETLQIDFDQQQGRPLKLKMSLRRESTQDGHKTTIKVDWETFSVNESKNEIASRSSSAAEGRGNDRPARYRSVSSSGSIGYDDGPVNRFPCDSKLRKVLSKAIRIVWLLLGKSRHLKEFSAGGGKRLRAATDLDDLSQLHAVEAIQLVDLPVG